MLELAILGLLKEHPMHGYDLRKRLRAEFGLLSSLSFGSLYPALGRLETEGAVREQATTAAAPPAEVIALTGSLAGERAAFMARLAAKTAARANTVGTRPGGTGTRGRKIYELTPRGSALFGQLLTEETARDDGGTFALRWAFAKHLTPETRLRLLGRRRRQLEDRLASAKKTAETPSRPLDRYERSLAEHSKEAVQLDLDWIDRLIDSERTAQGASSRTGLAAET